MNGVRRETSSGEATGEVRLLAAVAVVAALSAKPSGCSILSKIRLPSTSRRIR
jgi:hypothetical protein